jgi:hypothetical protein
MQKRFSKDNSENERGNENKSSENKRKKIINFKKLFHEYSLDELNTRAMLDSIHKKYFSETSVFNDQFLYRKSHYNYLKEAIKEGIDLDYALNFHDEKIEPIIRKLHQDKSGGQRPRNVVHVNSSEDRSPEIFSYGSFVENKKLIDGAFAIAINVRKPKHIPDDFQPSAYINGHLIKHDNFSPLYEPIIVALGKNSNLSSLLENAEHRRKKLIEEYKDAGFHIVENTDVPYKVSYIKGKKHKTYFPILIHDLSLAQYYLLINSKKVLLQDWFKIKGLEGHPAIQKDIEALERHAKEKDYFEEYLELTSRRKKSECTDSREDCIQNNGRSNIRIIGSILNEEERRRVLETPGLKHFVNSLHFNCGYLTTAMKLHEAGKEIENIFKKGEREGKTEEVQSLKEFFKSGIFKVFRGEWKGFSINDFFEELKSLNDGVLISDEAKNLLFELLKSQNGDLRMIVKHMYERKILEWDDQKGVVVMPAALRVDSQANSFSSKSEYYNAITLEVAKDVEFAWAESLNKKFMEKLNKSMSINIPTISVTIKSYKTGISYILHDGKLLDPYKYELVDISEV